jgi:hypothetical protein
MYPVSLGRPPEYLERRAPSESAVEGCARPPKLLRGYGDGQTSEKHKNRIGSLNAITINLTSLSNAAIATFLPRQMAFYWIASHANVRGRRN